MSDESTAYSGWAVLELMGHRRLAGQVSEAAQYGTAMIRIDIPTEDGQPPITQFYGGGSIYCLTPVTEEAARAVAKHHRPAPVQPYELAPPGLPSGRPIYCRVCEDVRVEREGDLCDDCDADDEMDPR